MGIFNKLADNFKKDVLEEKNIWKTLGYAAGGIGAVAALPVFGAVGAVSGVGAVVGVAGGLAAKHIFGKDDSEKFNYQDVYEDFIKNIKEYSEKNSEEDFNHILIALSAVGVAVANEDEGISKAEKQNLDEFFKHIENSSMPNEHKNIVLGFLNNPPSFKDAIEEAKLVKNTNANIFREMILLVGHCDGYFSTKEKALLNTFDTVYSLK